MGALRRVGRRPLFDYLPGYGLSPQIAGLFSFHILGTAKLSRTRSTGDLPTTHRGRSGGCGFVDKGSPQTVDEEVIHKLCTKLSTDNPQAGPGCPQRSAASPHGCPLFGNTTRLITVSSERRHTKLPGRAVGKPVKAGDEPGEKSPQAVHGVCRTFCSPQNPGVVHCLRPQGRWTKSRP